jgi:hypothetical protein
MTVFLKCSHKLRFIPYKNKPAIRGAKLVHIGIPVIEQKTWLPKRAKIDSINHVITSQIVVFISFITTKGLLFARAYCSLITDDHLIIFDDLCGRMAYKAETCIIVDGINRTGFSSTSSYLFPLQIWCAPLSS